MTKTHVKIIAAAKAAKEALKMVHDTCKTTGFCPLCGERVVVDEGRSTYIDGFSHSCENTLMNFVKKMEKLTQQQGAQNG